MGTTRSGSRAFHIAGCGLLLAACGVSSESPEARGDRLLERPALQRVVEAGQSGRVDPLRRHLADADPAVRARAAFGAATVGDPSLIPPLIVALGDSVAGVREDVAFALARLGPSPETEVALVERLDREGDLGVLREVADALGFIGGAASSLTLVDPTVTAGMDRVAVTRALARMSARGVLASAARDSMVDRLTDPDRIVRLAAARGFAAARGPDVWIRYRTRVEEALAGYGLEEPAARPLLQGFGRLLPRASLERWRTAAPDPRTRRAAVEAVAGHSDGLLGLADLAAALHDRHPWVRGAGALGLAGMAGSDAAVDALESVVGPEADAATEEAWLRVLAARGRLAELRERVRGRALDDAVAWRAVASLMEVFDDPGLRAIVATAEASPSPYVRGLAERARAESVADAWPSDDATPEPAWSDEDWAELGRLGREPRLELVLPAGRVTIRLDPDQAPATVLFLARRAAQGAYDGVPVHRVVPGVLAQWGRQDRVRGPPRELTRIQFRTGVVGWALGPSGSDDDLFVALDDLPELDGRYTAIGWVIGGFDVWANTPEGTPVVRARVSGL